MTVDPKSFAYNPSPLKQYLASLNVPYYYEEQGMLFCYFDYNLIAYFSKLVKYSRI